MMESNKKSYKELLMQRMFLAIVSNIAFQFFLVCCSILLMNLSIDIISWLQNTWKNIASFKMWTYFIVLSIITFLQGIVYSKSFLSRPPYLKNRFIKIQRVFVAQNLLLGVLYMITGSMLAWLQLCLKEGRFGSSTENYGTTNESYHIEEYYLLILNGTYSGLDIFIKQSFSGIRYFKFPIIPQFKFSQFKRSISATFSFIVYEAACSTIYFMFLYYFLGLYFNNTILFGTPMHMDVEPLSKLSRLLSLSLMLNLWLSQLMFKLMSNSMILLFEIFLTEWIPFELQQTNVFNNNNSGITLTEALSMDQIPIIQHLGYLDLVTLAQMQKERRNVLFTLSQPGGHPYNWNCVIEKCLNIIKTFSENLNAIICKEQQTSASTLISSTVPTVFQHECTYHMRSLVMQKVPLIDEKVNEATEREFFLYKYLKNKWETLIAYFLSKPLIYYFFGEQEETKVQYSLFDGQAVIWAAKAISTLAVVSLKEDSYGIVQKDLPNIIYELLTLKHTLDKLQKSNILIKKQFNNDRFVKQMFASLKSASKRSLYRITTGFENYIQDLNLELTAIEQLQPFLNYKE